MKTLLTLMLFVALIIGCKQDNLLGFDTAKSYIYFAYAEKKNTVENYTDSIFYSFAMDEDLTLQEKEIKIPVRIAGLSSSMDRTYKYVIDESSKYDPTAVRISNPVISANKFEDTLRIHFKRVPSMLETDMEIKLNLELNDQFHLGNTFNNSIKIVCNDVLNAPSWWVGWQKYFGPFYKEVFQKWMQIYYLGVDKSPDLYEGTPGPVYYWNNMPTGLLSSFPITFMYLKLLKNYFEENVVYPNGDNTKDRILLP
ncbi:DUF4843 domain-containing protein [Sphingobacterium sp. HJSM2_6]|uniref:DUF4843 domain-containing protein n=1 Tax=Sphingobacterium sp. HJSM2_6 TaxID=3366264 RepID=UPI003BD813B3